MWWSLSWRLLFAAGWTLLGLKRVPPGVAHHFIHQLPPNVVKIHVPSDAFSDHSSLPPAPRPSVLKLVPPMVVVHPKAIEADVTPRVDRNQIIYRCGGHHGNPETIRDLKGFLRWGCQPSPLTCEGFRKVPRVCPEVMIFSVYNWTTSDHVNRLFKRCEVGPRPFVIARNGQPQRFIPYCVDFINYLQKKYENDERMRGGRGPGEGQPPIGGEHYKPPELGGYPVMH